MNKATMIKAIAEKTGFTQKDVTAVVDALVDTVVETVASGDTVKIYGLGAFSVAERAERVGRNPQTGETIQIPAFKSPRFKAAKAFKDAVK